jgi:hypothetical protein
LECVKYINAKSLAPEATVVSDGLMCFSGVTKAGCTHEVAKTGSGAQAAKTASFKWVNTALGEPVRNFVCEA